MFIFYIWYNIYKYENILYLYVIHLGKKSRIVKIIMLQNGIQMYKLAKLKAKTILDLAAFKDSLGILPRRFLFLDPFPFN